jgi:vacuolar iron transporter family protein
MPVALTGLAGLLAGAASMAAGEFISTHTQREATLAQLAVEKQHLLAFPQEEAEELQECLEQKLGVSAATAAAVIRDIQQSEDSLARMLTLHAKFEHGINPERLGNPLHSAIASYCSFAVGGAVPLLPWFLVSSDDWHTALYVSCCLSALALLLYDTALIRLVAFMVAPPQARATAWARAKVAATGGLRQLGVGAIAAGTTYGVGVLLGSRAI